jgi:preprotein translocase subunit SecD
MTNASRAAASLAASFAVALALVACDPGRPTPTPAPSASQPATLRFEVPNADDALRVGAMLRARLRAYGAEPGAPTVAGRTITIDVRYAFVRGHLFAIAGRGGLQFRGVLQSLPPGECAEPGPRETLVTRAGSTPDAPRLVTCAETGAAKYVLGPPEPVGEVVSAEPVEARRTTSPPTWVVSLRLPPEPWAEVTGRHAGKQLAIVLDGAVWSAPRVETAVTDGSAEIDGSFGEDRARVIAALASSGPIDVPVTVLP